MADQDSLALEMDELSEKEKAERQKQEDELELKSLQAKYGKKIAVYVDEDLPGGRLVISTKGKRKQYQELVNALSDDKQDSAVATEQFALACVVEPADRLEAKKVFEEFPALASKAAGEAMQLAGAGIRQLGKA